MASGAALKGDTALVTKCIDPFVPYSSVGIGNHRRITIGGEGAARAARGSNDEMDIVVDQRRESPNESDPPPR